MVHPDAAAKEKSLPHDRLLASPADNDGNQAL
ncbi:hypothetical protein VARIO8X_90066 [Burkholderiales bacterium 8X]|nr:hypothetical protein VARIO8X_90066 [Burkholderiales bacterium 8X]